MVRAAHPRIFYTPETIPELVERCRPGGVVHAEYVQLKTYIDAHLEEQKALPGAHLPGLCIVYQVEKGKGGDVSHYVDYLVNGLWGTDGKGGGSELEQGEIWFPYGRGPTLQGHMGGNGNWFSWDAMAFDWFYDSLTAEQRLRYGNLIGQWMHSFMGLDPDQPAHITLKWGSYIFNQTWGFAGNVWGNNYSRDGVGSKTPVALALAGEGTDFEASVREWLESWAERVPKEFLPALETMGGAFANGPGHGMALLRSVLWSMEAWRTATGQDLFPEFHQGGLKEAAWWMVFGALPHNDMWAHHNDTGGGVLHPMARSAASAAPLLGKAYDQPHAEWLTERFPVEEAWDRSVWEKVLWHNPSTPSPDVASLPTAYLFQGTGQTYMRSGWSGPDDTWAYFVCGPHYVHYQSQEDGTFQIYKGGGLAMRAGSDRETGVSSTSMNAVLVYNPDEVVPEQPFYKQYSERNDGGVRGNPGNVLEPVKRGHLSAFQHVGPFTYAAADLSDAYDDSKIESYTRQFLYLRSDPECFVVYDRLNATKAEFPKLWQLHTMNEPVFYDGSERLSDGISGPGSTAYPRADRSVSSAYAPENNPVKNSSEDSFLSNGYGALLTTRLLPEQATTTGRGGEGHDNWGNPFNPNDDKNLDRKRGEGQNLMDRSWWRIEVTPDAASKETEFLHVLAPILVSRDNPKTAAQLPLSMFPAAVEQTMTDVHVLPAGSALDFADQLARRDFAEDRRLGTVEALGNPKTPPSQEVYVF